ncbi:DUF7683 domain-containing protein [Paraburkholderia antibiotica]|uniref:DUF7683 domain-containing protein n=1 Tax=Paraburkholderia antibiotica TaxID=2728839 RepID=A0A7Y0A2W2_9BURK|nr:hypothetical protein [Paraburkholderia antibiotica]NML35512.1 hypothetical protein [Paraburkholderia antibiotica]
MTEYQLHRYISAFEKEGDAHVCNIEFVHVPNLEFLQALFDTPAENPMYDVGAINSRIAEQLNPYLPFELDCEKYEYFLECDRV